MIIDFSKNVEIDLLENGRYRARVIKLENGRYRARVIKAEIKLAKPKKTANGIKPGPEMVVLKFETQNGAHVYDNLVNHPKVLGRFKTALEALGIDTTRSVDLTNPGILVGRECIINVGTDLDYKRNFVQFDGYSPIPGGESETIDDDDLPF